MKKIIMVMALAGLLSGCQVVDLVKQKVTPQSSTQATKVETVEQNPQFQKLDEQFERVKQGGVEIEFNGEKYWKMTRAVKGEDPRFVSLAVSQDRTQRKSLTSDTLYLKDLGHEAGLTQSFLNSIKSTCEPQTQQWNGQTYYACSGQDAKRFIALVFKDRNILSFRSLKSYQYLPTEVEEKAIVQALTAYPVDSMIR